MNLSQALAEEGLQVITAENGKQALMRVEDFRPDLILSDIDRPEMNGVEFGIYPVFRFIIVESRRQYFSGH